jgi:hypothetical protein
MKGGRVPAEQLPEIVDMTDAQLADYLRGYQYDENAVAEALARMLMRENHGRALSGRSGSNYGSYRLVRKRILEELIKDKGIVHYLELHGRIGGDGFVNVHTLRSLLSKMVAGKLGIERVANGAYRATQESAAEAESEK